MKVFKVFRILSVVIFVASCAKASNSTSPRQPIRNGKPGSGTMMVMGDSLAHGFGATDYSLTPAGCLGQKYGGVVTDVSQNGYTSDNIAKDIPTAVSTRPHLIFVSLGGNDAMIDHFNKGAFPIPRTMDNMGKLFDALLGTGALVAYLALAPPYPDSERLPQIAAMARQKGVLVIDGMQGLWDDKSKMNDSVHPNDEGYKILCQRMQKALDLFYP
jgi:acyl-CoA thioesterase I